MGVSEISTTAFPSARPVVTRSLSTSPKFCTESITGLTFNAYIKKGSRKGLTWLTIHYRPCDVSQKLRRHIPLITSPSEKVEETCPGWGQARTQVGHWCHKPTQDERIRF